VAILTVAAGCNARPEKEPTPFSLAVTPGEVADAVAGQRCVLLVTAADDGGAGGLSSPVRVSAAAPGAVVSVEREVIGAGEVAEVWVVPEWPESAPEGGFSLEVAVTAERAGVTERVTVPIAVASDEEDLVEPLAAEKRDLFLPWLAEEHPELGITEETEWTGTIVTLHWLVVTHYLYFSDEWEMHLCWHVMIPPYNWARIELRRRFEETLPSLAFEIPSVTAEPLEVQSIEPAETLWR